MNVLLSRSEKPTPKTVKPLGPAGAGAKHSYMRMFLPLLVLKQLLKHNGCKLPMGLAACEITAKLNMSPPIL